MSGDWGLCSPRGVSAGFLPGSGGTGTGRCSRDSQVFALLCPQGGWASVVIRDSAGTRAAVWGCAVTLLCFRVPSPVSCRESGASAVVPKCRALCPCFWAAGTFSVRLRVQMLLVVEADHACHSVMCPRDFPSRLCQDRQRAWARVAAPCSAPAAGTETRSLQTALGRVPESSLV